MVVDSFDRIAQASRMKTELFFAIKWMSREEIEDIYYRSTPEEEKK